MSSWSDDDDPPPTTRKNAQYLRDEKLISEFCIRYASYKHTIHLLEMQNHSLKIQIKLLTKNERRKSLGQSSQSKNNQQLEDEENARKLMVAQKKKQQGDMEERISQLQDELADYRKTFKLWWRWRR